MSELPKFNNKSLATLTLRRVFLEIPKNYIKL